MRRQSPPQPSPSAVRRNRLVVGGVAMPIALIGAMLGAEPAEAASATVTTKSDLVSAMTGASYGDVITLGTDLRGDGGARDVLTVPNTKNVTLDLKGYELDLDRVVIGTAARLVVSNSTVAESRLVVGGASFVAGDVGATGIQTRSGAVVSVASAVAITTTGSAGRAGIGTVAGDAANALLYVNSGATVTATGGVHGAGIGGGEGAAPLSAIGIGDATVTATGGAGAAGIGGGYANPSGSTIDIDSTPAGTVTATGGAGGAGIGGGMADPSTGGGAGADLTVRDGDVTVADGGLTPGAPSGTTPPSAIGGGQGAAINLFGDVTNTASGTPGQRDAVRIAPGARLAVPTGRTITNSGLLVVRGTLGGSGGIDNTDGTIRQEDAGTIDDTDLTVTGRNFTVAFDAAGGTTTAPVTKHVYAPSLAAAGLDLSSYTGTKPTGRQLFGWTGTYQDPAAPPAPRTQRIGNTDPLTDFGSPAGSEVASVPLTAVYERPIAFTASTLPNAATDQQYGATAPVTGDATAFSVAGDPSSTLPVGTIPSLPTGLAVDPATGAISGRPTTAGHHSFVLTATSGYQTRSQAVGIDVAGAPVIATSALPAATAGTAYQAPILATSDSGGLTFALVGGTLPPGLQLDAATGVLSGTPTAGGTSAFTVRASNAFGSVDRALSIAVAAARVPPTSVDPWAGGSRPVVEAGTGGVPDSGTSPATGSGSGTGTSAGAVTNTPSGTGTGTTTSPTPQGVAAARPVLPRIPAITVKLGRPLSLGVAAASTSAVSYSVQPAKLPKGLAFDGRRALLYGAPLVSGRFSVRVTATNSAGAATHTYAVVVPAATRRITGSSSAITPFSGKSITVTIRGLSAGERWRIAVDGKPTRTGVARFGGSVQRSVRLPASARDRRHTIRVSGDRPVADLAVLSTHELTVTAVVAKKRLTLTRSASALLVRGLAPSERVTVRRGHRTLARGRADPDGRFSVTTARVAAGSYTVVGARKHRTGTLRVQ